MQTAPLGPRGPQPWWTLRQRLLWYWPLFVVLLVAGGLRFWALFPSHFYGDDAEYATVARYLMDDPVRLQYPDLEGLGPQPFVSQPPLLLYLFAAAGTLTGSVETGALLVSAVLGTATCSLVYALGLVCHGRASGAAAGLVLALIPIHVDLSRRAFLDAGLTFFVTLALLFFLLWLERRTAGLALATGIAAAAAVFTKLPGFLVFVPLAAGLALELRLVIIGLREPTTSPAMAQEGLRLARHAGIAAAPAAVLGVAYIGLLSYLDSSKNLFAKLGWQADRVTPGSSSANLVGRSWDWYLTDSTYGLPSQFGFFLTLACLAGFIVLFHVRLLRVQHTGRFVLLVWPVAILLFFTVAARKEWFYIVPAMPPLALLCGLAVGLLATRIGRAPWPERWNVRQYRGALSVGAAFLLLALPLVPPAAASLHTLTPTYRAYGSGYKPAAAWIHGQDPQAGQIGTLLGRFSLHFYDGQVTYHYYVNHTFVEDEVAAGNVRFVVIDDYLPFDDERAWMTGLVARHNGKVAWTYGTQPGETHVWVYDLRPA